ncbi:NAD-dependent epimerase/dehydratase family protein [Candidatus Woesearchaeota archaeon]|nr:NAD-dependent epimerase/dehydratase family protein [Candidatus Woesearchaeota archaeon]
MRILVTGGIGLIGSACCELFLKEGHEVISVDNNTRESLFGDKGNNKANIKENDFFKSRKLELVDGDIRDKELMSTLVKKADAIVHLAAQPSHPKSLKIPIEDFQINAFGTVQLLELARQLNPKIPFAFMSTNKVYGDYPNFFSYKIMGKRYENVVMDSFNEELPVDRCGHTPFGASKLAADIYTQEYAINYGLKTATFRGGCLTGKNSRAVEMHGYLPYIIKCALTKKKYYIYGGGYRVRDQIHSSDVASALYEFIKKPKPSNIGIYGKSYNLGGERQNSISIFETIDAIKAKTGILLDFEEAPERESDHLWWISDMSKFRNDYPSWRITKDLDYIFNEIIDYFIKTLKLSVKLKEIDYFKKKKR